MSTSKPALILFGSGAGIGYQTALQLAQKSHFRTIVLIARNAERLENDRASITSALPSTSSSSTKIVTIPADLSALPSLRSAISKIDADILTPETPLGAVLFNAARIRHTVPLTQEPEELKEDFETGVLALYVVAQWAIPILRKEGEKAGKPQAFFVTNAHLPEHPMAKALSLSLTKTGQQAVVRALEGEYGKEIHFSVIKISGAVKDVYPVLNPKNIGSIIVDEYEQPMEKWTLLRSIWP